MAKKKQKIEISNKEVESDIHVDTRPAEQWTKEPKYKVYMELVDLSYRLFINPDITSIAEKLELSEDDVGDYIKQLADENLIENKGKGIKVKGLNVTRLGEPVCAFCGSEMEKTSEKTTESDYIYWNYKCPLCKEGTAQFRVKGVRE